MRTEKLKPPLAKGAILAKGVRLAKSRLVAGTVIGNTEIQLLYAAKVKEIQVTWMGLGDLIAHAAAAMVAKALAAGQLDNLPGRGATCELASTADGILVYEPARLETALDAHPAFKVKAPASGAKVAKRKPCVKVSCSLPVSARKLALEAAAAMPPLYVRPFMPLKLTLLHAKNSKVGLGTLTRQLKAYGSSWSQEHDLPSDASSLDAQLAAVSNYDVILALCSQPAELSKLGLLLSSYGKTVKLPVANSDPWITANIGKTTVVVLAPAGNLAALRKLLNLLHAGVALTEDALAETRKQKASKA